MKVKVAVYGTVGKVIMIDPDGGATIGENFRLPDGSVPTLEQLKLLFGGDGSSQNQHKNLQGLQTGDDHPQYTMWNAPETIKSQWDFQRSVRGKDGSAADPSFSFTSDTDTGIYRIGADHLGVSIGGTTRLDIDTTDIAFTLPMRGPAGSASAPTYSWSGDDNTGLYSVGTDNLGFSTGGTARWDLNTVRVQQTLPLILNVPSPSSSGDVIMMQMNAINASAGVVGGMEFLIDNVVSPTDDDRGAQFGMWEGGQNSGTFGRQYPPAVVGTGYRWRLEGSENSTGDLVFRSHSGSASGTEIYRHARNAAQMYFVGGTNSAPTIAFDDNTGIYSGTSDTLRFTCGGTQTVGINNATFSLLVPAREIDGSAGTPSFSFTSDTNTGLYSAGADQIGFSVGGTNRWTLTTTALTSSVLFQGPSGAATGPTYSFSGDPNTGVYSAGADDIGFATSGTLRFNINTTQIVSTLPLRGPAGSASAPTYSFSGDTNTGAYSGGTNIWAVATDGNMRFGLGAAGELLDGSGDPGDAGEVPTSNGAGAAWAWGTGGSGGGGASLAYVNTSVPAGNTVANTASETAFDSDYDIPANQLIPGSVIRVKAFGVFSTTGTPNLRLRVKLDGNTRLDTAAIVTPSGVTNNGWHIDAQFVVFTDGASGTVDAQGLATLALTNTTAQVTNMENSSTAAIDTTVAETLSITAEWGTADPANTITLRELAIELMDSVSPTAAASAGLTFLTEDNETANLPNSRQMLAGTNMTFDDSVAGERTINAAGAATVGCHVQRQAAQLVVTANVGAAVSWDTEVRDDAAFWDVSSPTRLTIPTTGWYVITASTSHDAATGFGQISIRVNGATIQPYDFVTRETDNSTATQRISTAGVLYLTAGDYVEIWWLNNTANRNVGGAAAAIAKLP